MQMKHLNTQEYIKRLEQGKNFRLQVYNDESLTSNEKYVLLTDSSLIPFVGTNYQEVMVDNHITALKCYVRDLGK